MVTSTAIATGGLGRFGNQMFTIAGVIGVATKNGTNFGFKRWKNHDNALFGDEVTDFNHWFINPLPDDRDLRFQEYGYFWGYRDINLPPGNWSINAHFQSPKFFEHCIDVVRFYFTMNDEYENDYCAIHYRAGDYQHGVNVYHPRQPREYYKKAIEIMGDKKYLVFSDNKDEAEQLFTGLCDFKISQEKHYMDDFRLMKNCKDFIIANSSYSAMAALLSGRGKVIAPKMWFGTQANISSADIYHKDWIVI